MRFAAGTDKGNAALICSAFTDEAVVDFGPCGIKHGLSFQSLERRNAIVRFLLETSAYQITSYIFGNLMSSLRSSI
ncbi:hypothetical protein P7D22_19795 [Lichenihabitans sp. Uapishka_5]|uniref:hypothetical protein n=1 Tax=Lichenihabitans sp. Uapishka_5 TaxID=3037302 RepID=UPI0029E7F55C|nr:hypothetical protein [Lichenihabitans sp. Uapishka_5]MDX7953411.1 hypothetical protein [Lichenihabitans sp. Uapishka_5]